MIRNFFYLTAALLLISTFAQAAIGKKDTVMIYQPGPGLNDSTDMGGINSGMDSWVYEGNPSTNYKNDMYIITAPISNCNSTHSQGLIRFDLGNLPDTVDSVFVGFTHFEHTSYCYSGCNADFFFARATQPWYENDVSYTNKPTTDTAFYGPVNVTFPNNFGTREYDITNTYKLWRDSTVPNYGMMIYSNTVTCNNAAVMFYVHTSDDTSIVSRPYLKIYYKVDTGTVDTGTAISKVQFDSKLKIYPNPAASEVTAALQVQQQGYGWYAITDIAGRVIVKEEVQWQTGNNNIRIPLHNLDKGMYFYMLYTPDGRYGGKLMKQ